eukprot:6367543-Amphidinium_carterae.1
MLPQFLCNSSLCMETRESVLEFVRQSWKSWRILANVGEVWRSDREVVLTAVRRDGQNLEFVAEALKGDREIVLAAVQHNGFALEHAADFFRADREVVLAAVQQDADALGLAADDLLEDPTFATEAKRGAHLLKLTMLSGRSTVVAAWDSWTVEHVLARCRKRLALSDDGATMELWHGSERVPDGTGPKDWPGVQPLGEITECQLLVRR